MNINKTICTLSIVLGLGAAITGCDVEVEGRGIEGQDRGGSCSEDDGMSPYSSFAKGLFDLYLDGFSAGTYGVLMDQIGYVDCGVNLSEASLEAIRDIVGEEVTSAVDASKASAIPGVAESIGGYERAQCADGKSCDLSQEWSQDSQTLDSWINDINDVTAYFGGKGGLGAAELLAAASVETVLRREKFALEYLLNLDADWGSIYTSKICSRKSDVESAYQDYEDTRDAFTEIWEEVEEDDSDWFFGTYIRYCYRTPTEVTHCTQRLLDNHQDLPVQHEELIQKRADDLARLELHMVGSEGDFQSALGGLSSACGEGEPDMAEILAEYGLDANGGDPDGGGESDGGSDPHAGQSCGRLQSGSRLESDEEVKSCNGAFALRMQGDGNLKLNGTDWKEHAEQSDSYVVMQGDGNLVLRTPDGEKAWSTGSKGDGAYLRLRDDGNLVVYSKDGDAVLWESGTGEG
ncbi:MAG: hypothetical protein AB1Z98_16260 [Nannocystaceae bacterium]